MPDILKRLGREMLVLEGAMGTMLQRAGMTPGTCPELLNVQAPEMVEQVHSSYATVGADCSITNTFGASRPKLAEFGLEDRVEELNRAGVRIAKRHGAPHVLADMAPTGLIMEPLGSATFEELFDVFAEQARALAMENPDAILLETFTDIAEIRCAVLAAKSVSDLPVIASITLGESGRMDLSGTDPETAAVILEAAGADAIGVNCGLGPEQMLPLVLRMVSATTLPVIGQPNAGLPRLDENGKTIFPGTPDEMGVFAAAARNGGVAAVGSCCGSSPSFTGAIADEIADKDCVAVAGRGFGNVTVVAGPRSLVTLGAGQPMRVIGERINPTGKPALKESLLAGSMSVVRAFAVEQTEAGADLLDVNVGAAGVDAAEALPKAVLALVGSTDLPLVLDTTDAAALEAALRLYPGKALVNSVNGDPASLESVLPLVAAYGAAVVALALDDNGIPADAEGRIAIVERIREAAESAGISSTDLVVDGLVMTAATDEDAPRVTLETTKAAKVAGLSTMLGVSNVSHGLPDRPLLNAAFIAAAAAGGLDAAIANPNDHVVTEAVRLANQARMSGSDLDAHGDAWPAWEAAYAASIEKAKAGVEAVGASPSTGDAKRDPKDELAAAVLRGDAEAAPGLADAVIAAGTAPADVIGAVLTPAIQRLGDAFGRGEIFLPQMMVAADAMKSAVARVREHLPEGGSSAGKVAFATVKGDIHSIGKDICISLLESQGFDVEDLGSDVEVERVVEAAAGADVVCLSALMTTTLPAMQSTAEAVRAAHADVPVFVGGAVVTAEWAESIGAGYSADAPGCVEVVRNAIGR